MVDHPEEGPSVASMSRVKLRHNRRSLLSTSVGTGTRAIRNAKPKDDLGCIPAKHVIYESVVVGESIGPRASTAIAQSVDGRPSISVVVLGEEKIQVCGIALQDVVVGSTLLGIGLHRSMGDDVLPGWECCLEADGNIIEEILGILRIIVILIIYVHSIKILGPNNVVELIDYVLLLAVAVFPAVVHITGPRTAHTGTTK
mmetsp:Transcript_29600/g.69422  ORF Transcript_29600/g.69422 Transcript_29600/m.69422 type:complete len:200 (+) Transcript_29600:601-1200(+)